MIRLAIQAEIPLVGVSTNDIAHSKGMLEALLGGKLVHITAVVQLSSLAAKAGKIILLDIPKPGALDFNRLYVEMAGSNRTLIILNPGQHDEVFDAGVLSCPDSLILRRVKSLLPGSCIPAVEYLACLRGLSYREINEVIAFAGATHGKLTPQTIQATRRAHLGSVRGLYEVNCDISYYLAPPEIKNWLAVDGLLFSQPETDELTPRGLIFNGPPGTGKSMGAKYLARELKCPLYLLNMGAIMGKYYGESEDRLQAALSQAESCAPAVLLIDEVEKIFSQDDSGVSSRLLAQLLWWLEEHKSKVLTLMTTNDQLAIPPELYRPGRIDAEVQFKNLTPTQAVELHKRVLARHLSTEEFEGAKVTWSGEPSPAQVVQKALAQAKAIKVKQLKLKKG